MTYKRSVFPEGGYDQLPELYDLPPSMASKAQEYQTLKMKANKTQQEIDRLNQLSIELQNYLITPEWVNRLGDAITGTQKFFVENVNDYVEQKQTEIKNYVDTKKSEILSYTDTKKNEMTTYVDTKKSELQAELNKFTHRGEYNPTTQYYKKNTVTYQGETYLCLQDTLGNAPDPNTNTPYWAKIAARGAKGEKGEAGTGLRFKGAWSPTTQYFKDDAVQYGGQIFACMQDNIGQEPNPNQQTTYWALAVAKGSSTKVTTLKNTVTVNNTTTNVSIGIPEFNASTDSLLVIKNTTTLAEGVNYQINPNGASIDSLEGIWDGTQTPITFHFIVFKNFVVDLTFSDGNMIQDGTISKSKLKPELQAEINDKATQADLQNVDNKIGVLSNLNTTDKSNLVNAFNAHSAETASKFTNINLNIIDMAIELETLKGATLNGVTANIFIETFQNLDDINLMNGIYDSTNKRLVL